MDVVWDICKVDSLKTQTRDNRGYGSCLRVESNTKVPANWNSFLRCEENKIGLFQYLLKPTLYKSSIHGQKGLSAPPMSGTSPLAFTQEEATRGFCFMLPTRTTVALKS